MISSSCNGVFSEEQIVIINKKKYCFQTFISCHNFPHTKYLVPNSVRLTVSEIADFGSIFNAHVDRVKMKFGRFSKHLKLLNAKDYRKTQVEEFPPPRVGRLSMLVIIVGK